MVAGYCSSRSPEMGTQAGLQELQYPWGGQAMGTRPASGQEWAVTAELRVRCRTSPTAVLAGVPSSVTLLQGMLMRSDRPAEPMAHVSNTLFLLNIVAESCRTYTCTADNKHIFFLAEVSQSRIAVTPKYL